MCDERTNALIKIPKMTGTIECNLHDLESFAACPRVECDDLVET